MKKLAPYIVSFIAFLICVGIFVFGGFKWEDRGFGWGYIFLGAQCCGDLLPLQRLIMLSDL